jgi:hypothetical protein
MARAWISSEKLQRTSSSFTRFNHGGAWRQYVTTLPQQLCDEVATMVRRFLLAEFGSGGTDSKKASRYTQLSSVDRFKLILNCLSGVAFLNGD